MFLRSILFWRKIKLSWSHTDAKRKTNKQKNKNTSTGLFLSNNNKKLTFFTQKRMEIKSTCWKLWRWTGKGWWNNTSQQPQQITQLWENSTHLGINNISLAPVWRKKNAWTQKEYIYWVNKIDNSSMKAWMMSVFQCFRIIFWSRPFLKWPNLKCYVGQMTHFDKCLDWTLP